MNKLFVLSNYLLISTFSFIMTGLSPAQGDSLKLKEEQFVFPHTLNRLFSIPNSKIINSLDFSFLIGSSFGFADNTGVLGTLGLGLGGYGDIEIGSESLLGSMFSSSENFTNIGIKVKILTESENIPGVAIGIKANNSWNSSRNDGDFIRTSESGLYDAGLRTADYDSRMTSVYAVIGKMVVPGLTLQAGIDFADLRYKNVYVVFNEGNSTYMQNEQEREAVINFFGGFEYHLNNRTILMFELQSYPYLKVSTTDGLIKASRRIVTVAGFRFFISKWLLLDTGVRYQDNYSGLAETEIRIGLNGIWNLGF
jgi:hypothetical protein